MSSCCRAWAQPTSCCTIIPSPCATRRQRRWAFPPTSARASRRAPSTRPRRSCARCLARAGLRRSCAACCAHGNACSGCSASPLTPPRPTTSYRAWPAPFSTRRPNGWFRHSAPWSTLRSVRTTRTCSSRTLWPRWASSRSSPSPNARYWAPSPKAPSRALARAAPRPAAARLRTNSQPLRARACGETTRTASRA